MRRAPLIFHRPDLTYQEREIVSIWFGLALLVAAFIVDRRFKEDYAFWGYLFGMMALWGGMAARLPDHGEIGFALFCLFNIGFMLVAVVLQRPVIMVFGAIGCMIYLGHLAYDTFKDSLLFPIAVSLVGVLVIIAGILYQRNRAAIEGGLMRAIPDAMKRLLPSARVAPAD